jgi:hypothetical protein
MGICPLFRRYDDCADGRKTDGTGGNDAGPKAPRGGLHQPVFLVETLRLKTPFKNFPVRERLLLHLVVSLGWTRRLNCSLRLSYSPRNILRPRPDAQGSIATLSFSLLRNSWRKNFDPYTSAIRSQPDCSEQGARRAISVQFVRDAHPVLSRGQTSRRTLASDSEPIFPTPSTGTYRGALPPREESRWWISWLFQHDVD